MLFQLELSILFGLLQTPERVARMLVRTPEVAAGQTLELRTRLFLTLLGADPRPRHAFPVAQQRAHLDAFDARAGRPLPAVEIGALRARLPGRELRVRTYRPAGVRDQLPALVYLHGGGFTIGSPEACDSLCAQIAVGARCLVFSVDYRLAPEHPFPAALDDAVDAFRWIATEARSLGADPGRLLLGGDSAGGNLTAVACRLLADSGGPSPSGQVLIYPATDFRCATPSFGTFGEGFFLTADHVRWFRDQYLPDAAAHTDPRVSPLLAGDLTGLPPAIVVLAGLDPLHDEGLAYAIALRSAGVGVDLVDHAGLIHGFVNLDGILPAAATAVDDLIDRIRGAYDGERFPPPRGD